MAYDSPNDYRRGHNGGGDPEKLEEQLEHTRAEIDDTLAELERKLTPGELLDETIDYLRTHGPGPFVTEFAEQIKERPLPAALSAVGAAWATRRATRIAMALARKPLPSTLTAVGLAWFMMAESRGRKGKEGYSDARGDDWSDASEGMRDFGRKVAAGAERVKSGAAQAVETLRERASATAAGATAAVERLRDRTSQSAAAAGETAEEWRDRASGSADDAFRAVGDATTSAGRKLEDTTSQLVETAAAAAAGVKRAASDAMYATRDIARSAAQSGGRMSHAAREYTARGRERTMQAASELEDTVRRHPLVTATLLVAAGAVCAAMLPTTRRENELFGETLEDLAQGARERARFELERGKRVASAAVEGAIEGAKERATEAASEPYGQGSQGESFTQRLGGSQRRS